MPERSKVYVEDDKLNSSINGMCQCFAKFQIEVRDLGHGIPPDKLNKLFVDFGKLDDPDQTNVHGTGLGLSISKKIIEEMEGNVRVESKVDKGSRFIITLRTTSMWNGNQSNSP